MGFKDYVIQPRKKYLKRQTLHWSELRLYSDCYVYHGLFGGSGPARPLCVVWGTVQVFNTFLIINKFNYKYMYACLPVCPRWEKGISFLKLELQAVVSPSTGVGNQTWFLCKSSKFCKHWYIFPAFIKILLVTFTCNYNAGNENSW